MNSFRYYQFHFIFLSKLMSGSVARTGTNVISTHFLANRVHLYLPHINTYLHKESRLLFHLLGYDDHLSGTYFAFSMTVLKRGMAFSFKGALQCYLVAIVTNTVGYGLDLIVRFEPLGRVHPSPLVIKPIRDQYHKNAVVVRLLRRGVFARWASTEIIQCSDKKKGSQRLELPPCLSNESLIGKA